MMLRKQKKKLLLELQEKNEEDVETVLLQMQEDLHFAVVEMMTEELIVEEIIG